MKYIYDIILNFTDKFSFYEYYEWQKNDELINIRKAPIFKIESNTLEDFINNEVKVDENFLKVINNKYILYKKDIKKIKNVIVLSNGEKSIGISFDNKGHVIYKSPMLIDEEDEANKIISKEKYTDINYQVKTRNNNNYLRIDNIKRKNTLLEIQKDYKNKEYSKLKYLYYEIFNKECDNMKEIYKKLLKYNK